MRLIASWLLYDLLSHWVQGQVLSVDHSYNLLQRSLNFARDGPTACCPCKVIPSRLLLMVQEPASDKAGLTSFALLHKFVSHLSGDK